MRFPPQWIPVLFLIYSWESAYVEGQLYVLIYATLCRGLECLQILASLWDLEPIPEDTEGS